jgi:hypothetical protein
VEGTQIIGAPAVLRAKATGLLDAFLDRLEDRLAALPAGDEIPHLAKGEARACNFCLNVLKVVEAPDVGSRRRGADLSKLTPQQLDLLLEVADNEIARLRSREGARQIPGAPAKAQG